MTLKDSSDSPAEPRYASGPDGRREPSRMLRLRVVALLLAALFAQPAEALEVRYEGTGCPLPTNVVLAVGRELARLIQSH